MKYLIFTFLIVAIPYTVSAHPGRTDAQGGHYCRTNCEKWGMKEGEYHFHDSIKDLVKPAKTKSKINSK